MFGPVLCRQRLPPRHLRPRSQVDLAGTKMKQTVRSASNLLSVDPSAELVLTSHLKLKRLSHMQCVPDMFRCPAVFTHT